MRSTYLLSIALVFQALSWRADASEGTNQESWVDGVQSLHYFAVSVADVDAAVAWYRTALGLAVLDDEAAPDDRWRIVNLTGETLHVEVICDARAKPRDGRVKGIAKVGFGVRDVDAIADRVEAATGERPRIVESKQHGIRILQLRDPEGNVLQLHERIAEASEVAD